MELRSRELISSETHMGKNISPKVREFGREGALIFYYFEKYFI